MRLSLRSLPNGTGRTTPKIIVESVEDQKVPESSNIIKKMLDPDLLTNVFFLLYAVSNFCTSIGYNVPYVYIEVSI